MFRVEFGENRSRALNFRIKIFEFGFLTEEAIFFIVTSTLKFDVSPK